LSIQLVMMEQGLLMRLGAAASLVGHGAVLGLTLLFASVQPFQSASSKPIKIDLVPQQELDQLKAEIVQPPQIPPPSEPPNAKATQEAAKPTPSSPKTPAQLPASAQQAAASPAAAAPQPMPPPPTPAPQAMPALLPMPMQAPDVTQRYHVMLGLPADSLKQGSGGQAAEAAKIATSDTDKLRAHLRGCASLPASIGAADKIKIVMRAVLSPDGTLAHYPTLIEASASPKGPALMQAAITALQACQPYNMLPADKYKEWRVLDIPFTPLDFKAG
jgi:hypothetical protein